jgi:hypothetical protein
MVLSRDRMCVPAALVAVLLLLNGAGEVLGACHCAHRGGSDHGSGAAVDHRDHGGGHHESSAPVASPDTRADERGAEESSSTACRTLCALACSVQSVTSPAPDLLSFADGESASSIEPADLVPPTARPHVLPLALAPPTTV